MCGKMGTQNCIKTKEDKILITHGTDTMVDTVKILDQNFRIFNKEKLYQRKA